MREEIFEIGNEGMSVTELSQRLALPTGDIVKSLFMKGIMVQVNQVRPIVCRPPACIRPDCCHVTLHELLMNLCPQLFLQDPIPFMTSCKFWYDHTE